MPMPLVNNKVGDDGTDGSDRASADEKALVDSLGKVVACYRHLASCVGGCTDTLQLRDELRQTREKAQKLAAATCQRLTARLRDKGLPAEERVEAELLWVAFSSSLELLHADLCKVFHMGNTFPLADMSPLVQTGMQGGGSEVAARALSLPDLNRAQSPPEVPRGLETRELGAMEQEIDRVGRMIGNMEQKVNVPRWTVEPRGPQYADPLGSADSVSGALLLLDEEQPGHPEARCPRSQIVVASLLCAVVSVATALSVCIVLFS